MDEGSGQSHWEAKVFEFPGIKTFGITCAALMLLKLKHEPIMESFRYPFPASSVPKSLSVFGEGNGAGVRSTQ